MSAVEVPIEIEQGATFFMEFVWANDAAGADPVNLTGAILRMQIRKSQQTSPLIDISSDSPAPALSHGAATGLISIKIPAEQTSLLTLKSAKYDMEAVMANGDTHRVVEGPVTISPNITQVTGEPVL